jgi:hypothetical protein
MKTKKKKKEIPKTVKSKFWYWKGSDIFGEGRKKAGVQKRFGE